MLTRTLCCAYAAAAVAAPQFRCCETGDAGTKTWRMFLKSSTDGSVLSPWHDVPLHPELSSSSSPAAGDPRLFVSLTEIPRGTRAKMELCKEETHNPITQDLFTKKPGQPLRFFAYGEMPFNYGFLPRTWEDPAHVDARTGCVGDGDPIDVVHLGPRHSMGQCEVVRVLGVLGLIDVGETDWKIVVESAALGEDKDAYGSIDKVPQNVKEKIVDWFENYKVPDGKPKNEFAFNKEIRGAETALEVIAQCALQYDALMAGKYPDHGYWLGDKK